MKIRCIYLGLFLTTVKFDIFRNIKDLREERELFVFFFPSNFLGKVIKPLIKKINCWWKMSRGLAGLGVLRRHLSRSSGAWVQARGEDASAP